MRWRATIIAAVMTLSMASTARADHQSTLEHRRARFAERGGELIMWMKFSELFDAAARKQLSSGFPARVVVRVYIYRVGAHEPVSLTVARYRIVYDLWGEVYIVRSDRAGEIVDRRYRSRADAVRAVTRLDSFPVAPLSSIPIGPHHFAAMVVELNPVSDELLAETRRWLTQPAGGAEVTDDGSVFGSFVSVFVNPKLAEADRVVRLRSQPFYRVPR